MAFLNLKMDTPRKIKFHMKDIDLSIVNCIRRVILSDIPNIAIRFDPYNEADHDVHISANTSPLHNEILSHRLSLIPIHMHPNEIRAFQKTHYKFVIDKQNTTNDMLDVDTDDIQVFDFENNPLPKERCRSIFPKDLITNDPILIAKLKPNIFGKEHGDELKLEAFATMGTAANNAAWSPVSLCSFYNDIDEDAADKAFKQKVTDISAKKPLTETDKKELRTRFDTLEKFKHFKKNRFGEPNLFVFTVESECAMTPDYLVFKAISILCDNIEALIRDLESENDEKVKLEPLGDAPHMYQLSLFGQTHTMGNLLQAQFYNKFVRHDASKTLEYVGYICPHPLDKTILVKLKFASSMRDDLIRQWIIDSIRTVYHDMYRLGKLWLSFASVIEDEYDDVMDYIKHGNAIPEPTAQTVDEPAAPEKQEEQPEVKEVVVVKPKRASAKKTKK